MSKVVHGAIDVDDNAFTVALKVGKSKEMLEFSCKPNFQVLLNKLKAKLPKGSQLKICYEATYSGFALCRYLKKHGLECEVIAPSLIPEIPGKAQKTNRLDARSLANFYSKDDLVAVHIPTESEEIDRDLCRSRKYVVETQTAMKNHIMSLCKRLGWNYKQENDKKSNWTCHFRKWLDDKIRGSKNKRLEINFKLLLDQLDHIKETIETYNAEIESMAKEPGYKKKVESLIVYRGIDIPTAMVFTTEFGDMSRFDHPNRITSYVGMDLREYSTGKDQNRFGISKNGNRHLRTAAIESCQFALKPVRISKQLKERRKGIDKKYIEIADRCMSRLHKKGTRLLFKGKPRNKVKTACGRELFGFIWESLKLAQAA